MRRLPVILLLLAVLGFAFGLAHLFRLRFAAGDIYPEYSSFRADPLGAKALYRSLGDLLPTRRNYQPASKLGEGKGTTLLLLGVEPSQLEFTPGDYRHVETFLRTGGRLVIAIYPTFQSPRSRRGMPPPATPPPLKGSPGMSNELANLMPVPITERWGLKFDRADPPKNKDGFFEPAHAARKVNDALPEFLDIHSSLFFDKLDTTWRVIYARPNDRAVLIERRFGDGSLVLFADSYPFSNQALRESRQTALLTWILGACERVAFDEVHLGVQENPGIAALARKYRLEGLFFGLLGLAALFIWRSVIPFVPAYDSEVKTQQPDVIAGRESAAGFINLLRRNIPEKDLLATCLVEWRKSCAHQTPQARLEQLQAVIDTENSKPERDRNAVAAYRRFCEVLAGVKRKTQTRT